MQKEDEKYLTLIIREFYGILKDGEELVKKVDGKRLALEGLRSLWDNDDFL
jgi:hypothetical protein